MNAAILPELKTAKCKPVASTAVSQAIYLQQLVIRTTLDPDLKPAEVSGLVRAWCDVNEERRKLSMKPLPKSIDVTKLPKRGRAKTSQPSEPTEPPK